MFRHNYSKILPCLAITVLAALYGSVYTVQEGQQAFLLQNGQIKSTVRNPGLHFKVPFWETIVRWDTRLQTQQNRSITFTTSDHHSLTLNYNAIWRIEDPKRYLNWLKVIKNHPKVHLNQLFNEHLYAWSKGQSFNSLIQNNYCMRHDLKNYCHERGIALIALSITQWNPSSSTQAQILNRMRVEQAQIAKNYMIQGVQVAEKVRHQAHLKAANIVNSATEQATALRTQGETQALSIYLEASRKDPNFIRIFQALL